MDDGEALITYVGRAKTLRAELAGAGHPIGEDTAVMHVLAGRPSAYKTVTTVLMAAGVSLQWDELLPALLPAEMEQKETAHKGAGSRPLRMAPIIRFAVAVVAEETRAAQPQQAPSSCYAGQADASSQSGSRTYSSHIWIIDSGASLHMTNNSSQLVNISTDGLRVTLANGETAAAMGKGSLRVSPQTGIPVTLEEVLYVPSLADNLLSVRAVTRRGGSVEFIGDACAVHISARMAMMATPNSRKQYEVVMQETPAAAVAYGQASSEVARLWHRRYCHLSATNLRIRRRFDN
ncbi:hypothetical protein I4F81_002638 [Pyropia yezoensis]|uniref:Uncharacterized protein n=1 Tax=Pyropia yezoensis TaxID=2788 RepID=A0ACC3BRK7_PYRYE|nr:hypothetical protein I4F81_002638 [Neopyropia yezoensis]